MPINVGDVLAFSIIGSCYNQRILFTHTYRVLTPPPSSQSYPDAMNAFLDAVTGAGVSSMMTRYLSCLCTDYGTSRSRAQIISPTRQVAIDRSYANKPGGQDGGTTANIAAVITCKTLLAGRNQISNKHIGPISSADVSGGNVVGPTGGNLASFAGVLDTGLTISGSGSYLPCIYHRHAPSGQPITTDIVDAAVQLTARTMRRRTVGLGE